ncbi:DUF3592 domain-containing protein [Fulvivirga sediminis]|uniref:DUF3592 domain-containing protein n=1 Tax=Fulvivirga sediminis TaxID=2803949 RepID=A0A937JZ26_9BACT|nr:hypothetical protein [Fulvivirga sediminis]MBL3656259.1 hypothetical protein [Fulvivirga sediminis]
MNKLTKTQKLKIYFHEPPYIIGEMFLLGGVVMIFAGLILLEPKCLGSFIFISLAVFFLDRKIKTMKRGCLVLENGHKTIARVISITNTSLEHNSRVVKEYNFRYEADGKSFLTEYRSAYKRYLRVGYKVTLYYLPGNPKCVFIPEFYGLSDWK